jgi:hypothetical protein
LIDELPQLRTNTIIAFLFVNFIEFVPLNISAECLMCEALQLIAQHKSPPQASLLFQEKVPFGKYDFEQVKTGIAWQISFAQTKIQNKC